MCHQTCRQIVRFVIPMLDPMRHMSEDEYSNILEAKLTASQHFPALLNVTDVEKRSLLKRAFGLRPSVADALLPQVTDSHHRIAENYSMLIAATELVRCNILNS